MAPEAEKLNDVNVSDPALEAYLSQWAACVRELQQLEAAARATTVGPVRGLRRLQRQQLNGLERATRNLHKTTVSDTRNSGESTADRLEGGGSCSWLARWAVVRRCRGLVHVNKEFPRSPRLAVAEGEDWLKLRSQTFRVKPILVHAVVDNGATWIKFVDLSHAALEKRILYTYYTSDEEEDEDEGEDVDFACDVRDLYAAARWNHCRHVRVVLCRVEAGVSASVDGLLARLMRTLGRGPVELSFTCANSPLLREPPPSPAEAVSALLDRDPLVDEDRPAPITHVVNLDPSILLGMVSDLTHGPVEKQPLAQRRIITVAQQNSLRRQRGDGGTDHVGATWPDFLSPVMRGRELVCTRWAARYFRDVVASIATHSEAVRASLILPPLGDKPVEEEQGTAASLCAEMQTWSSFPIPSDLQLPVRVVDDVELPQVDALVSAGSLPPMASAVAVDLSPLNRSVYMHGWAHGLTTLSAHRGVVRQVELSVARHWTRETEWPPDVLARRSCGFLAHREKPTNWKEYLTEGKVPEELARWTRDWTTWGRGINAYGVADTKAWDGVGHHDVQKYGRRRSRPETAES